MSIFKVGDKVRVNSKSLGDCDIRAWNLKPGDIVTIGEISTSGDIIYFKELENRGAFAPNDIELVDSITQQINTTNNNQTNNNKMNNLIEKFKIALKGEPEKTLIKAGIMNSDETLTQEGRDLYQEWRFQQDKAKFTEEVASKILAEQEAEANK